MPLNRLEAFIKSTDGRIIYVNPSDINATDSVTNDGTSLTRPFITLQRALLESARFSFVAGANNDFIEKTTVLLYPGEYIIDNRPGWGIRNASGTAKAFPPSGSSLGSDPDASTVLSLQLDSNFDLTQENNILYKFNSIYGGVIIPRGTSVVGLDLRKTKIRPKYVPNPTDSAIKKSAIFRVTGACYFWQFSMFDGDESGLVYTHPSDFSATNRSTPTFSHHKLTCFEYADGVNEIGNYGLTDLDMYYSKLSNAYNSIRAIDQIYKYPTSTTDFVKREPEWKIVGAFASDPVSISNVTLSGTVVTITTNDVHNLDEGTPIKIKDVSVPSYNVSTKVQKVINSTQFTYLLSEPPPINAQYPPSAGGATVTVETDTVSGASPYIFNCSLRSVWGMNGMFADGAKASGFRSMVVAQFTAVSLQKDDRAFVKYDTITRSYNGVGITTVTGSTLPNGASQTETSKVYHLDPESIYRKGWESSHIKIANDAFVQIVSVFAIGFNKHFDLESGADASITNSNSNFGQISLSSDGFRAEAFDKDNNAFITSIIPPRDINPTEETIEWLSIDVGLTTNTTYNPTGNKLYLYGFNAKDNLPVSVTQGYRIGARANDKLYLEINDTEYSANILMQDGVTSSYKVFDVTSVGSSVLTLDRVHGLVDGEKIIINSETGDLPENVVPHTVYYAIVTGMPSPNANTKIKLATSSTNAKNGEAVSIYDGTQLKVYSRVSDKNSGDIGSPIQFDESGNNWYLTVNSGNAIYNQLVSLSNSGGLVGLGLTETTDLTYVKRIVDDRSLDEKLYKVRVVIPKELVAAKDPQNGFVIQESSSTGVRNIADFTRTSLTPSDYDFNKNPRFITTCTLSSNTVTVLTDLPHDLKVGDIVLIKNVTDSSNTTGKYNSGYNGKFAVSALGDSLGRYKETIFRYSTTDVNGVQHTFQTSTSPSTNNTNNRTTALPRFEKSDLQSNLYVYRNEVISPYIQGSQDGIYHLYVLNASNRITEEFDNLEFSQSPVDLYPQLDRDNPEANPPAAKTFALRSPIGDTNTSDLKKSITRETIDKAMTTLGVGLAITSFSGSTLSFDRNHGLGGIVDGNITNTNNSGYNVGTFYNVKLLNNDKNPSVGTWNGVTAKVVVIGGGKVNSIKIISSGSGYSNTDVGNILYLDNTIVGDGDETGTFTITGISTSIGDVVQITGIGTTADSYHRITGVTNTNQISIGRTSGDPTPISGQYAFIVGPSSRITASPYSSTTKITTFTTDIPHGLIAGNKFRVIDSSNNNKGDYVVKERVGINTFTSITNQSLSVTDGYILKHGLSANDGVSDISNENFAGRQVPLYGNEYLRLSTALTDSGSDPVVFTWFSSGIGTDVRFPMGSYIQIDNELMRITSSGNSTSFQVLRGVLGTRKESHTAGSLIRKIHPVAVEFHRPSILRASGHTFEYLGYGPGNYSTSLPQIQIKSLSEREEFLVQAQERSCGTVVYTGMNNNGDSFNGNTKTSSVSGEITSYDIPTPTVTGQDPSKSSVVYDEVTIKEKLLVEGGDSGTVLSQFDGPVTFNQQTRFKNTASFSNDVRITNTTGSDSTTKGALTVKGGVGILENLNLGGNLSVTGTSTLNGLVQVNVGIVPDEDEGAYLGTTSLPFSEAHIGEIRIANGTNNNTIDTASGNLTLNATVGSSVGISTNLTVSGTSTLTGLLDANGGAEIDNIRIGVTDNNTIDTASGNLTLNATVGSSVGIDTNLTVSGITTIRNIRLGFTDSTTINTVSGNLTLNATVGSSVGIDTNLTVFGTSTLTGLLDANGGAEIDNIRIGVTDNNTIDTSSSNLTLNAATGSIVAISTNTTISGVVTATRFVSNVATGTAPLTVSSSTKVDNLNADLLDGLDSATANTASTIVARDASGNFSANTITATLSGNATSATSAGSATYATSAGNGLKLWGVINSNATISNGGSGGWSVSNPNPGDNDRNDPGTGGNQGRYKLNFSPALPLTNYCIIVTALDSGSDEFAVVKSQLADYSIIECRDDGGTRRNSPINFMIIY